MSDIPKRKIIGALDIVSSDKLILSPIEGKVQKHEQISQQELLFLVERYKEHRGSIRIWAEATGRSEEEKDRRQAVLLRIENIFNYLDGVSTDNLEKRGLSFEQLKNNQRFQVAINTLHQLIEENQILKGLNIEMDGLILSPEKFEGEKVSLTELLPRSFDETMYTSGMIELSVAKLEVDIAELFRVGGNSSQAEQFIHFFHRLANNPDLFDEKTRVYKEDYSLLKIKLRDQENWENMLQLFESSKGKDLILLILGQVKEYRDRDVTEEIEKERRGEVFLRMGNPLYIALARSLEKMVVGDEEAKAVEELFGELPKDFYFDLDALEVQKWAEEVVNTIEFRDEEEKAEFFEMLKALGAFEKGNFLDKKLQSAFELGVDAWKEFLVIIERRNFSADREKLQILLSKFLDAFLDYTGKNFGIERQEEYQALLEAGVFKRFFRSTPTSKIDIQNKLWDIQEQEKKNYLFLYELLKEINENSQGQEDERVRLKKKYFEKCLGLRQRISKDEQNLEREFGYGSAFLSDFSGWDLKGTLVETSLSSINFQNTILDESHFISLDLEDINFEEASLEQTEFVDCRLKGITFQRNENIDKAKFHNCDFHNCEFVSNKDKIRRKILTREALGEIIEAFLDDANFQSKEKYISLGKGIFILIDGDISYFLDTSKEKSDEGLYQLMLGYNESDIVQFIFESGEKYLLDGLIDNFSSFKKIDNEFAYLLLDKGYPLEVVLRNKEHFKNWDDNIFLNDILENEKISIEDIIKNLTSFENIDYAFIYKMIQKLYNNEILQDMEKYSELYNNSFPNIRPSILYDLSNYDELQKYHQEKERLEKLRSKISVILIKKGFLIDLILNLSIFTNVNSQKPSLFEVMSDMYRNEIFSNTALTMNLKNCKDLDIRDFLYSTKFPYFFEKHYKDLLNNKEHFKNWDDNRFVSTMIDKGLFYELFGILNQFTGLNRDIFNQLLKKSEKDIDYWRLLYKERKSFETVDEKDFLYHIPSFVRAGELESLIQNISNLDKHVFLTLYDKFFGYDELSLLIKYRENFGISDNVLVETFLYRNDNVMTQFTRMHLVVDNLSSFHDLSRVDAYFLAKNGYFEQVVQNRESFRDLDLEQLELYKESA